MSGAIYPRFHRGLLSFVAPRLQKWLADFLHTFFQRFLRLQSDPFRVKLAAEPRQLPLGKLPHLVLQSAYDRDAYHPIAQIAGAGFPRQDARRQDQSHRGLASGGGKLRPR